MLDRVDFYVLGRYDLVTIFRVTIFRALSGNTCRSRFESTETFIERIPRAGFIAPLGGSSDQ